MSYVRLAERTIFKKRYGQWYLIDTSDLGKDRLLLEGGAELVLLSFFAGKSKDEVLNEYDLSAEALTELVQGLVSEKMVEESSTAVSSLAHCYDCEPPLDSLNILITNACNLRCKHCYVSSGKPMPEELGGEEWIKVLQEARRLGVFGLNVSGGEATLHPDFKQIAGYIASVPTFNANLNTNAFSMQSGLEHLIAKAFRSVQVSLDDVEPEKHDAFRGRQGCFHKSLQNIRRLREAGVETNVGFTLTRQNLGALDGLINLCEEAGVSILNIGFIADVGRASSNGLVQLVSQESKYTDAYMDQMYKKMRELAHRHSSVRILLPFRVSGDVSSAREKQYICDGDSMQIAYIMANGAVMPCDKLPTPSFSYGNVKSQSLAEVWLSGPMKNFKLMGPKQLPKCQNCPHLKICGGACVARAFQAGGSLDSPDWTSCIIAQKYAAELATQL